MDQFSVVVREPRQNLPSGPWVSKGWEPLFFPTLLYHAILWPEIPSLIIPCWTVANRFTVLLLSVPDLLYHTLPWLSMLGITLHCYLICFVGTGWRERLTVSADCSLPCNDTGVRAGRREHRDYHESLWQCSGSSLSVCRSVCLYVVRLERLSLGFRLQRLFFRHCHQWLSTVINCDQPSTLEKDF